MAAVAVAAAAAAAAMVVVMAAVAVSVGHARLYVLQAAVVYARSGLPFVATRRRCCFRRSEKLGRRGGRLGN